MSSLFKGLMRENGKRSVESVAREIVSYIGDDPSDSAIIDAVAGEAEINDLDPSELFDAVYDYFRPQIDENLRKWFKEKWVRFGPDGKIRGDCARGDDSEGKPKCLPQKKAQNLGNKGRKYAASKKRREDPNPERTGKAKNVATKKKTNEEKKPEFMKAGNMKPFNTSGKEIPGSVSTLEKLLVKARERGIKLNYANIDQMMQAVAKKHHLTGDELHNEFVAKHHMIPDNWIVKQLDEACWKGYHKEGNKKMFGKTVPNCVKNEGVAEEKCPHCGGELVSEEMMNEKQDACYRKVKSRYKVWPSAYASGALVQCRKKGASNWGTGGKKDESSIMKGIVDEEWTHGYEHGNTSHWSGKVNSGRYTHAGEVVAKYKGFEHPSTFTQSHIKVKFLPTGKVKQFRSTSSGFAAAEKWILSNLGADQNESIDEAGSPSQQAAIAIAMKKAGKKPKSVKETKAYQYAKISPEEVQEDHTGMYAAEKTPKTNPYGGLEDRQFRGAISEISDTNTNVNQTGGFITPEHDDAYARLKRIAPRVLDYIRYEAPVPLDPILTLKVFHQMQRNEEAVLRMMKQGLAQDTKAMYGNDYPASESVNRFWKKVLSEMPTDNPTGASGEGGWRTYRPNPAGEIEEDTAYGSGMGQGGNAGQSYRKFKPKSAGVIKKESSIMKGLRNEGE